MSDQNPNKDRAREMYRMLGDINGHLKKIVPSGDKRVNMWCGTCHQGRPRPMTLVEELGQTYRRAGIDATLVRYRELRDRFYGRGGYDFGERVARRFRRRAPRARKPGRGDRDLPTQRHTVSAVGQRVE